jgi:Peptidase family S41
MKNPFVTLCFLFMLGSCTVSKNNYNPNKKFSPQQLQKDYEVFRDVLEESHPSLYWYTPKDSVDYYFEVGANRLHDSLPEYKFRNVLSYVLAQIRCGHTSVRASQAATKYSDRTRGLMFPLSVKAWNDTVLVTSNLSRRDTNVMRGVLLKSIDNKPVSVIVDSMFRYISADGYNLTHKYQTISNGGVFRSMYGSIYGLKTRTPIEYIDTAGVLRKAEISLGMQMVDTLRIRNEQEHRVSRRERKKAALRSYRNMRIDTGLNTAFLEVNTFASGSDLRPFLKTSFKKVRKQNIQNLVVDMRGNGGGSVLLSNLLTKYIAGDPFKISDTLYALKRKSSHQQYMQNYFLNRLFLLFLTHKKQDGHYHFTHYENKKFKPKKKNHFDGTTYIVIGGNTFSAATLFTKAVADQSNVIVVGEETGGGAYGNTAWLIPDVTLPNTKVRFRLPLFRLVIDKNEQKGRGVMPEVEAGPSVKAIRKNEDYKMDKVLELIKSQPKRTIP